VSNKIQEDGFMNIISWSIDNKQAI